MRYKGRKQELQEDITEMIYDLQIEHDPITFGNALEKLTTKELEEIRSVIGIFYKEIRDKADNKPKL